MSMGEFMAVKPGWYVRTWIEEFLKHDVKVKLTWPPLACIV